ncbi:putative ribonuclease H-like domain-containing protein [Tanacetum coccineum]
MDLEIAQTTTTAKLPILKQENRKLIQTAAQTTTNAVWYLHFTIPGPVTMRKGSKEDHVKAEVFSDYLGYENILQEDLNLKFLRSLPSEWNTHVVVWRNKPDLDTMSFDDLYNNFKIVEQEVKGTASSSSSLSSQNMAFVSSPSSTNEVNTAYGVSTANTQVSPASTQVSTASTQVSTANLSDATVYAFLASQPNGSQLVYEDLEQIHEDDLEEMDLKWQLALLSMRTRRFFQKTGRKITINRSDTAGYDNSRRTVNVEETSSKAMVAIDGAGFDWSYMADDEVPTNMALMAFLDSEFNKSEFNLATYKRGLASVEEQLVFYKKNEVIFCEQLAVLKRDISYKDSEISMLKKEFQQPEFEGYGPKTSKSASKDISNEVRESPAAPLVEELVSDDKLEKKTAFPTVAKIEFVKAIQQEKPVRKPVKYAEMYSFDHLQDHCNYHQWERVVSGNNYTRVNYNYFAKKAHPSSHRNMVPRAVLMKTGLRPLNTARPVTTAHPKTTVYSARPMSHFSKSAQSTIKRPYQTRTTLTNKNFSQKVNTTKGKFYTARQKVVNTARPNSTVVNAVRANQGHPQKEDQGYVDSGCSRHMTGNMSYLSDFKEFDGGYVTFRGGAKGGKITGKGTLKTGKLDFEDVYFVKELQFNLFSVLQMCDKKNSVLFTDTRCFVLSPDFKLADESQVLLKVPRKNNMYSVDMKNIVPKESLTCLVAKATLDESMLWHRRLGHVNFKTINKLVKDNLVKGLPIKHFENDQTCVACLKGKQHKASCKTPSLSFMKPFVYHVTIRNTLDHLGTFDGNSDDGFFIGYSLNIKAFRVYNIRTRKVEENLHVRFLEDKPIIAGDGPKWLFDIDVLTKSMNYVPVVAGTNSNDFVGTKESIGAGHSSEETRSSQEYILMPLWKDGSLFDSSLKDASNDEPQPSNDAEKKDDEGGIDDQERTENSAQDVNTAEPIPTAPLESTYANFFGDESELDFSNIATTYPVPTTPNTRIHKDHSLDHVIGDMQSGVQTRRMINEQGFISAVYEGKTHEDLHTCLFACFLSQEEPKKVIQALKDPSWIEAMQEELLQFKLQQVWTLVDLPYGKRAIGTKWVYRNKKDERGIVIRNKERLVAQGYTQEEGIDYDEVFAPVARIKAIRLFLAYASFKYFVVYQMVVKSAFLYDKIKEEVYVCQPPRFEDPEFPDKIYKVEKALYGLHQAPRAWYKTLSTYLLDNRFQRGQIDKTLFIKRIKSDILLVQVYVDDIIFGSTKKELCTEFEKLMHKKFQISFMGELTFFLGLQIASTPMETSKPLLKDAEAEDVDVHLYRSMIGSLMYLTASRPDIMFVVCAYARFQVTPKVSHLHAVKRIFRYLKGQPKLGLWYPKDSLFELEAYTDSDYAGASLDRKSTIRGCQFLGRRLISWQFKKQPIVANSTTEAEYVAAASCCGQVLWIQNQMLDYGYNFMNTKIFIDNESTIYIVKNPVFHSKTKHIEIRHHFIRDSNEKKHIQMIKIHTDHNVTDLLTKAFDVGRFQYLIASIGMLNL